MKESRTDNVKKNIIWGNIGNVFLLLFSFINRTVFIYLLGAEYLGVSGLFTNVLGILSFSELGIGAAINFSIYKPIARNDREKIKSLMRLYMRAYRIIAVIVLVMGLILFPFLKYLVNSDIEMSQIQIFYLIFLFNTVSSYFVSYKTSYVTALQKNYIITNIDTLGQIVVFIFQIAIVVLTHNYLLYLIAQAFVLLLQKIITVVYINRKFPILTEKDAKPLDVETKNEIWKNIKALVIHKIGDVSVHQTDNLIISIFINTITVGLISNYIMLNTTVSKFTTTFFNAFTAGFGNLIAIETKAKQKEIFEVYDFLAFWIYGFVMISFITLSQPLISLWLGEKLLVDNLTMVLFFVSVYLEGQTLSTYNFKAAAGKFNEDKWVAFAQAIVNLIVSIIAVKLIGLPGVFVGTIAQRLIVIVVRPIIVYKYVFEEGSLSYFVRFIFRSCLIAAITLLMWWIKSIVLSNLTIFNFCLMVLIAGVVPNIIITVMYCQTSVFNEVKSRVYKRKNN